MNRPLLLTDLNWLCLGNNRVNAAVAWKPLLAGVLLSSVFFIDGQINCVNPILILAGVVFGLVATFVNPVIQFGR